MRHAAFTAVRNPPSLTRVRAHLVAKSCPVCVSAGVMISDKAVASRACAYWSPYAKRSGRAIGFTPGTAGAKSLAFGNITWIFQRAAKDSMHACIYSRRHVVAMCERSP